MKARALLNSRLPISVSVFTKPPEWESKNYVFNKLSGKYEYFLQSEHNNPKIKT